MTAMQTAADLIMWHNNNNSNDSLTHKFTHTRGLLFPSSLLPFPSANLPLFGSPWAYMWVHKGFVFFYFLQNISGPGTYNCGPILLFPHS